MAKQIRVRGERQPNLDLERLAHALLAAARAQAAKAPAVPRQPSREEASREH